MLEANGPIAALQLDTQAMLMFSLIAFMPALLLAMTAFTRVYIVLAILRQAIGIVNAPSNQILIGVALLMTFFIMHPVFTQVSEVSIQPYLKKEINLQQALTLSKTPFAGFMRKQVRAKDLQLFEKLAVNKDKDGDFIVTMAAFLTSELRAAFQIGFMVYVPFLIVDLLVAGILMSMGMIMVSPLAISLPFKLLLFVLVDGWGLLFGSLIKSFVS